MVSVLADLERNTSQARSRADLNNVGYIRVFKSYDTVAYIFDLFSSVGSAPALSRNLHILIWLPCTAYC